MDVSIIIVNYNSWVVLSNCIESILNLNTALNTEIIVVDNKSTNDLFLQYQKKFPTVKWISNSGNNGFANGCNLGAANANGDYLFFLNPDTKLKTGVLEHFTAIYHKENIGILSCLQTNSKDSFHKYNLLFPKSLRFFGVLRSLERVFKKKQLTEHFKETATRSYPDWISGSAIFISKDNFDLIEKWNEDYWMYFEDVDLCKKTQDNNLLCVITKEVSLFHLHGGASRVNPKTKAITKSEVIKSRHVYIANHFSPANQQWLHTLLMTNNMFSVGIFAILSFPLFFLKKLKVNRYKFLELYRYYNTALKHKTWLSYRSTNFKF